MYKKHHVVLSEGERKEIMKVSETADTPKTIRRRCNVLLLSDEAAGNPIKQEEITVRCGVSDVTVYQTAKDYCLYGLEYVLRRRTHSEPPRKPIVTGEKEARIVALACGEAPEGYARWTVRLLTEKVLELEILPNGSRETVRRTLKKLHLSLT